MSPLVTLNCDDAKQALTRNNFRTRCPVFFLYCRQFAFKARLFRLFIETLFVLLTIVNCHYTDV